MKRLTGLCLLALLPLTTTPAKTVAFEQVVPADVSLLVVLNRQALGSDWSGLPAGRLWAEPQVQKFLAPMIRSMEAEGWNQSVEARTGRSIDDMLALFTDEVVVGMTDLAATIAAGDDAKGRPGLFVLAAVEEGADDLWETLTDPRFAADGGAVDENAEYNIDTEEQDGTVLHVWQTITEDGVEDGQGWAVADGMLIAAEPRALLRRLVTAVLRGADDSPLGASSAFATVRGDLDSSEVLVYLNMKDALAGIRGAIATDPPEPNALGVTPDAIIEALGLDALQAAYLSLRVTVEPARLDYGVVYEHSTGLLDMIAVQSAVESRPSLVPADVVGASITNFDWMQMWTAMHAVATTISAPMTGMIDAQIKQLGASREIDLVEAILGNFGDETVYASFALDEDGPAADGAVPAMSTLVAISTADTQGVEMGLEALQSLASPGVELFEVIEYLGTGMHVSQPFPNGPGGGTAVVAYALTKQWLLVGVGSAEPVRRALAQIADPGRSLWELPQVRAGLAQLPPGAAAIGYQNISTQLAETLDAILATQSLAADESDQDDAMFDASARPDDDLLDRYFGAMTSGMYKSDRSLHFTLLLLPPAR